MPYAMPHAMSPDEARRQARAAFMAVRISTPATAKTKPFLFKRSSRLKNEWRCNPLPHVTTLDDELRDVPFYRFTLCHEAGQGWGAFVEYRETACGDRPAGWDPWETHDGDWFKTLPEAVECLRRILKELQARETGPGA